VEGRRHKAEKAEELAKARPNGCRKCNEEVSCQIVRTINDMHAQ